MITMDNFHKIFYGNKYFEHYYGVTKQVLLASYPFDEERFYEKLI